MITVNVPEFTLCNIDDNDNLTTVLTTGSNNGNITLVDGSNDNSVIGHITDLVAESDKVICIIDSNKLVRRITLS